VFVTSDFDDSEHYVRSDFLVEIDVFESSVVSCVHEVRSYEDERMRIFSIIEHCSAMLTRSSIPNFPIVRPSHEVPSSSVF
jgi:hypothetical protein